MKTLATVARVFTTSSSTRSLGRSPLPSQTFRIRSLIALLFLIAGAPAYAQTAITWQSQTNVTVVSTTLTKTGGVDTVADAGAISQQEIASGGGTFAVTTTSQSNGVAVGLSNDTATNSLSVMTHAFNFTPAGIVEFRELGTYKTETTYVAGDVLSLVVDAAAGVVYKKNGVTVYTSLTATTLPKKFDVQIVTSGSSITAAMYTPPEGGPTWTVCASGCDFVNSQLQEAINAATAGTT